jgi:RHS repeat-associated protein
LGRLILSQNAKQFNIVKYASATNILAATSGTGNPVQAYSYTLYDVIGRITEVGELLTDQTVTTAKNASQVTYATHTAFVKASAFHHQVSQTAYDNNTSPAVGFVPTYLRNRVAYTTYISEPNTAPQQTQYSYDVHGNVKSVLQMIQYDGQLLSKQVDYEYDLVSGKVNQVYYQKNQPDQLIHSYSYDGDNRITQVQTSTDSIIWTQEATYQYYAHGPLAQTTIGELKVETDNYSYTIQGWIKQMQGSAFGYALGYNPTDYTAIGGTGSVAVTTQLATPIATGKGLYNGNIATTASVTPQLGTGNFTQQYTYDQLNRITSSSSPATGSTASNAYKTRYSYDPNGNILSLSRYDAAQSQFDSLKYNYQNKASGYKSNTNKLRWVNDLIPTTATTSDIEDQSTDNYSYDAIGNLIKDVQEEIDSIQWTVSGKVSKVIRIVGSKKPNLAFAYDASGQRIAKKVLRSDGSSQTTYYIRDASGNVMGVYDYELPASGTAATPGNAPILTEQYLYGSSRLGVYTPTSGSATLAGLGARMFGRKSYELTDHLGDVRVAISDYQIPAAAGAGVAIVNSATDYYPFGMVARSAVSPQVYRYGFNGQEHEDDINSGGGDYDFGARIFDPRIARWLAIDPLVKKYPYLSPYNFAVNNPIFYIDRDGKDKTTYYTIITDQGTATFHTVTDNKVMASVVYSMSEHDYVVVYNHVEQYITLDLRTNIKPEENQTHAGAEVRGESISFSFWAKQKYKDIGKKADEYFPQGKGSEQAGGFHFVAKGFKGDPGMKSKSPVAVRDITELVAYLSATKFGPSAGGVERLGLESGGDLANYVTELVNAPAELEEMRKQEGDRLKKKAANEKTHMCTTCNQLETEEHVNANPSKPKTSATTKPKP